MAEPRTIAASELKSCCLALLDEVERTRQPLLVTKRGRPVARLVPLDEPKSLLGSVDYDSDEDLLAPLDDAWEADA